MGVDNVKAMIANAKKKETQVPVAQKLANLDKFTRSPQQGFGELDKWGTRRMAEEKEDFYEQEYRNQFSSNIDGKKQECEEHLKVQHNLNTKQFELFKKKASIFSPFHLIFDISFTIFQGYINFTVSTPMIYTLFNKF